MLNKGISFGLFAGMPIWVFVLVLILLVAYAVKMRELWGRVGVILIVIGGGMNTMSRLGYGGVVDYWKFFGLFYNNLADYLIFGGLCLYGYTYIVRR